MATDAEALAAGFALPKGNDFISEGDNAITKNAKAAMEYTDKKKEYEVIGVSTDWKTLDDNTYLVREGATATAIGMPTPRPGQLEIKRGVVGPRVATYTPNDPLYGDVRAGWENRSNSSDEWGTKWYRKPLSGMRSAPVVLSLPSIDSTQSSPNEAWRAIFTVNFPVERARIHVRARNFRASQEHGPVNFQGMGIARRDRAGLYVEGTMTNVPGGTSAVVPAAGEWVSDWFDVFATPGNEYMLCFGATFPNTPVGLSNFWGYTTTDGAASWDDNVTPRWGQVPFMPLEIWIETEVPITVPVIGYFGASTTMGMNLPDGLRYSYPQIHAEKHGAFAAHTAAGGWAITDESAWDLTVIDRFGSAGHCDDLYLAWGANELSARGNTAQEIYDRLVLWLERIVPRLGNPRVHVLTVRARPNVSGPNDPVEIERAKLNKLLRYSPPDLVTDTIDIAAVFDDPLAPWTRRADVVGAAGPGDTHPNKAGQGLWAQTLDGGGPGLPMVNPLTFDETAGRVVKAWDYANKREQVIYGDTGLRQIPGTPTAGMVFVRRSGNIVTMIIRDMTLEAGQLVLIPEGFRPDYQPGYGYVARSGSRAAVYLTIAGNAIAQNGSVTGTLYANLTYSTNDPWPTSLPGTAVGSIPV